MTLKDLQDDVYSLGYETVKHPDDFFINAANRALRIIFCNNRYKKTVRIHARYPETSLYAPITHYKADPVTLPVKGRGYSLRVCGKGSFTVSDSLGDRKYDFDSDDTLFRGFIDGDASIRFEGTLPYDVIDLSVYSEVLSDRIDDIPDGSGNICFDFSERADFLSFAGEPHDASGSTVSDAQISGSVLTVNARAIADLYVGYFRAPRKIYEDMDAEIDIPPSAESQLSLLCASFLWRDSDVTLADHYLELYRELSSQKSSPSTKGAEYLIIDGWA